jgi:hypothetical protein
LPTNGKETHLGRAAPSPNQRRVERAESFISLFHIVNVVGNSVQFGPETQTIRRKAVQMIEDPNESMRRRRLSGVDLTADEIERPLEPRDLEKREVICRIGVTAIKPLADDLLDTAQAELFRGGDAAHRVPRHQASEDPPRALMLLGPGAPPREPVQNFGRKPRVPPQDVRRRSADQLDLAQVRGKKTLGWQLRKLVEWHDSHSSA